MTDSLRKRQTPEQLILRERAAEANPDFATLEGRAMQDVRETIAYLAVGLQPHTVLGGIMRTRHALFDSTLRTGHDRDEIAIGVSGKVDPINPNERGDRVGDILEGLVSLGFVRRVFEPGSIDALLLPEDDYRKRMDRPTYELDLGSLPEPVVRVLERTQAVEDEIRNDKIKRERRKKSRSSGGIGILRRRR